MTLDQAGAGAATLRLGPPPSSVRPRVEHLWVDVVRPPAGGGDVGARPGGAGSGRGWRIVSDHCSHVLYHRTRRDDGNVRHRLALVGPRTVAVDVDRSGRLLTAGVRLRPWAVPGLFDIPAGELTDRSVRLREILGEEALELEARLGEASEEGALAVLAGWLARRPARAESAAERRARAATETLRRAGASCAGAARRAGISARALRTLMREQVGLAPKACARVIRLHSALRRAATAGRSVPWSRVAMASGYADQPHLIREFRRLLGETPGAWQARAGSAPVPRDVAGARRDRVSPLRHSGAPSGA
ncbi:MAG: helix-turn-helix transcriptional regulator [Gemmatimonadota bacterium]